MNGRTLLTRCLGGFANKAAHNLDAQPSVQVLKVKRPMCLVTANAGVADMHWFDDLGQLVTDCLLHDGLGAEGVAGRIFDVTRANAIAGGLFSLGGGAHAWDNLCLHVCIFA